MKGNKKSKFYRGFTLVELVVTITIIAILSVVSVVGYLGFTDNARKSNDKSLQAQLNTLVKLASDDDLVSATELRRYFKENGIESFKMSHSSNSLLYDMNTNSVILATNKSGNYDDIVNDVRGKVGIDGVKNANVIATDGTPLVLNPKAAVPEEIFAGKILLSNDGNDFSKFVYDFRNGDITTSLSYINKLQSEDNTTLASIMKDMINTSLFVSDDGSSSAYRVGYSSVTDKYTLEDTINYTDIKNVIFSENVKEIKEDTFRNYKSIRNLVVPSTVEKIDVNAFSSFSSENDGEKNMAVAFMCSDDVENLNIIKGALTEKGIIIADPVTVTEAIRTGNDVYVSGIKRYITVNSESELVNALSISKVQQGDCVIIGTDMTLTQEVEVPTGVQLLVPTIDNDTGYQASGFNHNGQGTIKSTSAYRTLTLGQGGKITVGSKGTVLVNSISGQPFGGDYDQDVNGAYGAIVLNGSGDQIVVKNGGLLDNFGYIRGNGRVSCENGGEVRDLYVVRSWRGGTQALHVYSSDVYPMNETDMHNIETDIVIQSGGKLVGNVKMYAMSEYYYTRFPQVDNENGLIRLKANSTLTKSYDSTKSSGYDYGKETYSITGGATFSSSTLPIVGLSLSTKDYVYPIDGDINFNLNNGAYDFDENIVGYKFMPGTQMVLSNSSLSIPTGVTVAFYDKTYVDPFITSSINRTSAYPSERDEAALTLNANSSFVNNGSFGGSIVVSDTTDETIVSEVGVNNSVKILEANGYTNGVVPFTFNASYKDATKAKVYYLNDVASAYNINGWDTLANAVSNFNSLDIVKNPPSAIEEGSANYTAAVSAIDKYFALTHSGITSTDIDTIVTNYSSNVDKLKNAINPVFTIGDTSYSDLATAIAAAKNGEVITVHNDYVVDLITPLTISESSNLTLDLNGYTLTFNSSLQNNGTLNITNGTIEFLALPLDGGSQYFIRNNKVLSMSSVNLIYTGATTSIVGGYVIDNYNGTITHLDYVKMNTFVGTTNRIYGIYVRESGKIERISNCTFNTGYATISSYGTIDTIRDNTLIATNTGSSAVAILLDTESVTDEIINCNIISSNNSAIRLNNMSSQQADPVLNRISGTFSANSTNGVIYSVSKTPITILNGSYFKNNYEGYEDTILSTPSSSSNIMWSTMAYEYEENYVLDSNPISDGGGYDGYYTTRLGYSVTYISTFHDETTGNYYNWDYGILGSEITTESYSQSDVVTLLSGSEYDKDSVNKHYSFVGWMDENGNRLPSVIQDKTNKIVYAVYDVTDHVGSTKPIFMNTVSYSTTYGVFSYGSSFDTIADAMQQASGNVELYLISDYSSTGETFSTTSRLTLHLNGKTLTFTEGVIYGIEFVRAGNISILGEGGKMVMDSSTGVALVKFSMPNYYSFYTCSFSNLTMELTNKCSNDCKYIYSTVGYSFGASRMVINFTNSFFKDSAGVTTPTEASYTQAVEATEMWI